MTVSATSTKVRVNAPKVISAKNVNKHVRMVGTVCSAAKCVAAQMMAFVITCLANALALPDGRDLCVLTRAQLERTVLSVNRSASAKTTVNAMRRQANVTVRLVGLAKCALIAVRLVFSARAAKKFASVLTAATVIT